MAVKKAPKTPEPTVRTLWGLAKSQELHMTGEELHLVVQAQTGKDSMRKLTASEIRRVAYVLGEMKDSAKRGRRKAAAVSNATSRQLQKIHALERELGWADDPRRLSGFCRRMFRVESVCWLTYAQCSKLIEALKKMAARREGQDEMGGQDEGLQSDTDSQEREGKDGWPGRVGCGAGGAERDPADPCR